MITVEDAPGLVIAHATLVLEREVVENGAVLIRDGRIAAVAAAETLPRDGQPVLDAGGAYLLPGLIDTHNDGLEREINPRPQVGFPGPFALANFERRSTAGGVTTTFHAIYFGDVVRRGRHGGGAEHRPRRLDQRQHERDRADRGRPGGHHLRRLPRPLLAVRRLQARGGRGLPPAGGRGHAHRHPRPGLRTGGSGGASLPGCGPTSAWWRSAPPDRR
jgi:hypothetical protein